MPREAFLRIRHVYLSLCIIGAALPYTQLIPWLADHGLDVPLLVTELFSTRIGGFFGLDVIVSGLVLVVFVVVEGRRLGMSHLWIPVAATTAFGVSAGLPLFLYLRQRKLDVTQRLRSDGTGSAPE